MKAELQDRLSYLRDNFILHDGELYKKITPAVISREEYSRKLTPSIGSKKEFQRHNYYIIRMDGSKWRPTAAQVVWFFSTGEWPKFHIYHADGDSLNDDFDNLILNKKRPLKDR